MCGFSNCFMNWCVFTLVTNEKSNSCRIENFGDMQKLGLYQDYPIFLNIPGGWYKVYFSYEKIVTFHLFKL